VCVCVCAYAGERSGHKYTDHVTVDSDSLLVRVIDSFDHERDAGLALTYRCHGAGDVTGSDVTRRMTSSCRARVVVGDVNDRAPHIKFVNSTTTNYDRLAPIQLTGSVRTHKVVRRH